MAYKYKGKRKQQDGKLTTTATITTTSRRQSHLLLQQKEIYHVDAYLKSKETKRMYIWHFNQFLKYFDMKRDSELLKIDIKTLESMIIKYLCDHLSEENQLKKRTVQMAMSAIFRFCMMNDIFINRKKISMQIPPDEDHTEDRAYTRDEIAELIRQSTDERFRVVIYLMANGLRVGAIPELQFQDLIPKSIGPNGEILDDDSGIEKFYQVWVYNRSATNRYYMFVTPECRIAIDKYLKDRAEKGEDMSVKTSPLIREQFEKGDKRKPRALSVDSFKKAIERTIKRAHLGTTGSVAMTHGLRKYAITQMIKAKVDYEVREFVSGHRHTRGLDISYDRLNPNERCLEWSKCINLLTINEELRLKKKLKIAEENARKLAQQEITIQELRAQLDKVTKKIYERDRRRMGLYDNPPKPVHVDISPEELVKVPPPPTQEERKRRLQQEKQSVKIIKV